MSRLVGVGTKERAVEGSRMCLDDLLLLIGRRARVEIWEVDLPRFWVECAVVRGLWVDWADIGAEESGCLLYMRQLLIKLCVYNQVRLSLLALICSLSLQVRLQAPCDLEL